MDTKPGKVVTYGKRFGALVIKSPPTFGCILDIINRVWFNLGQSAGNYLIQLGNFLIISILFAISIIKVLSTFLLQ